jgi:hypothetical protein
VGQHSEFGACSFQNLVHAVQHMLASGLFQLQHANEILGMPPTRCGHNRQTPYIDRGAQNRLMMVLRIKAQQLMSPISDWFQHLYYCEVLGLQAGQGQVYSADPWLPHDFLYNGHLMHINAAAHPVNVVVGAGHAGADYGRAQNSNLNADLQFCTHVHITLPSISDVPLSLFDVALAPFPLCRYTFLTYQHLQSGNGALAPFPLC